MRTKSLPSFVKPVKCFTVNQITDNALFHVAPQAQAKEKAMKKRVLLVDDDKDLVGSLKVVLEANGFEVVTAHNGPTGWRRWRPSVPTPSFSTS
jgi:PleD family two-component response regulator